MKKVVLGLIVGLVVGTPIGTFAYEVTIPNSKNVFTIPKTEDHKDSVSKYKDGEVTCYVLAQRANYNYPDSQSISCVRNK